MRLICFTLVTLFFLLACQKGSSDDERFNTRFLVGKEWREIDSAGNPTGIFMRFNFLNDSIVRWTRVSYINPDLSLRFDSVEVKWKLIKPDTLSMSSIGFLKLLYIKEREMKAWAGWLTEPVIWRPIN